jgi:hypothetical protein
MYQYWLHLSFRLCFSQLNSLNHLYLGLMSIQYKLKFTSIFQICLVCLFFHTFFQKGYWYWILIRGATGAARAPKLDKTPNTAARRRCRRRNLFYKIKVRPRSCRSYTIWRPCWYFSFFGILILIQYSSDWILIWYFSI